MNTRDTNPMPYKTTKDVAVEFGPALLPYTVKAGTWVTPVKDGKGKTLFRMTGNPFDKSSSYWWDAHYYGIYVPNDVVEMHQPSASE